MKIPYARAFHEVISIYPTRANGIIVLVNSQTGFCRRFLFPGMKLKTSCGKFLNLAHYFPYDVKLRLLAHSRSFIANKKARNAIVEAENLLKNNSSLRHIYYTFVLSYKISKLNLGCFNRLCCCYGNLCCHENDNTVLGSFMIPCYDPPKSSNFWRVLIQYQNSQNLFQPSLLLWELERSEKSSARLCVAVFCRIRKMKIKKKNKAVCMVIVSNWIVVARFESECLL